MGRGLRLLSRSRLCWQGMSLGSTSRQDWKADSAWLSYSRSKGLFAGLELKGSVIDPDNDDNRAVYSRTAAEILSSKPALTVAQIPAGIRIFPRTLARYSTRK